MQNDIKLALVISAIVIALVTVGIVTSGNGKSTPDASNAVVIEDGVQVITILAKGGYSPRRVDAKAGVPTEIRFETNGTYDCSSAVVIPDLGYQTVLAPTGIETLKLLPEQVSGVLKGQCTMAMYHFEIAFSE